MQFILRDVVWQMRGREARWFIVDCWRRYAVITYHPFSFSLLPQLSVICGNMHNGIFSIRRGRILNHYYRKSDGTYKLESTRSPNRDGHGMYSYAWYTSGKRKWLTYFYNKNNYKDFRDIHWDKDGSILVNSFDITYVTHY